MDIEHLRAYCATLKGTAEDIKWEKDLCFSVGQKMYCVANLEFPFSFSLKVPETEFAAYTEIDKIDPAPYLARHHWVLIKEGHSLPDQQVYQMLADSYQLVKAKLPKKKQKELGLS